MRAHTPLAAIAAVLISLVVLSACASSSDTGVTEEFPGYPGQPTTAGEPLAIRGSDSVQAWAVDELLVITTRGSSSCPTIPEVTDLDPDSGVVSVVLTGDFEGPCTADDATRTFEIPVDRDLDGFVVEVTIDF